MVDPIVYFGIGFLAAALLGLLFVPLVHNRAVRLTTHRLEGATPFSVAEIRADKEQLRAEFMTSTRRFEMITEQMNTTMTTQLAELGRKTDVVNLLRKELGQKTATLTAVESRDKNLKDQLRATEEGIELKTRSLRDAERGLADNEAEYAKVLAELGQRSITADSQRVELAALNAQIEAIKLSIAEHEHAVETTEESVVRARGDTAAVMKELDEVRAQVDGFAARTGELERRLAIQTTEAEILGRRVPDLEMRLGDQGRLLAEREFEIDTLRGDIEAARKTERDLRVELEGEAARAALRVENPLLRERIMDVAAALAWFIAVLEGPGSPIISLLAVKAPPLGNGTFRTNGEYGEGAAAMLDPQQPGKGTIADRIRALQSPVSRVASK
jgi:chromosome segregation ATPase